jgi:hypothetical protein
MDCVLTGSTAAATIGCCTHCGAGVCLGHARVETIAPQPIGVLPVTTARRALSCTVCTPRTPLGARGRGRRVSARGRGAASALPVPKQRRMRSAADAVMSGDLFDDASAGTEAATTPRSAVGRRLARLWNRVWPAAWHGGARRKRVEAWPMSVPSGVWACPRCSTSSFTEAAFRDHLARAHR